MDKKNIAISLVMFTIGMTALCMTGCDKGKVVRVTNDRVDIYYREVTIDGCQYIIRGQGICHKGNCTNHLQHAERP